MIKIPKYLRSGREGREGAAIKRMEIRKAFGY